MKYAKHVLTALLILGLFACAKPPQAEIDAAKAAVAKAAANSDVVTYAPEALAKAQDALSRMQTELTAKHYDKVKTLATPKKWGSAIKPSPHAAFARTSASESFNARISG